MGNANATAAAMRFLTAFFSSLVYSTEGRVQHPSVRNLLGYIHLPPLFGIALISMPPPQFGALLSHRVSKQVLRKAFGAILLVFDLGFVW